MPSYRSNTRLKVLFYFEKSEKYSEKQLTGRKMFIGHTRFSLFVPDSEAWRASNGGSFENEQEYKEYLYSDKRLELRTNIFLNHTIPTLQLASQNFDVVHIVSFSESLPAKFKERLFKAANENSVLLLDEVPDGDSAYGAVSRIAKDRGIEGIFGRYRLDDDDILSVDYFKIVEQYLRPEFVGMVVSLPLGIEAVFDRGRFFNLREAHVPMNSMGLLSICDRDANGKIVGPNGGPHDKSDRFDPVILDASGYGYFRSNHTGQDNAMRYLSSSVMDFLLESMAKFPPAADFPKLRENFPTIAKQLEGDSNVETIELNKHLNENLYFQLETPSPNLSLLVKGYSKTESKYPALVSFTFIDKFGNRLPTYKKVEGIGVSKDPNIGHFIYLSEGSGSFSSLVSLHLGHGYKVKAFKIVGLGKTPQNVSVRNIKVTHNGSSVLLLAKQRFNVLESQISFSTSQKIIDLAYRNRYVVSTKLKSFLGDETANKIIKNLASARRRLMR